MNYQKIYDAICQKRQADPAAGYGEVHHILPRSLGGSDDRSNLVKLTAREHFICHLLLVKIHQNSASYYKMVKAFFMMSVSSENQQRHLSSRNYEKLRKAFSESMSLSQTGGLNSQFGTVWIHSLELRESKKINKNIPIPEGWSIGRVINFDRHLRKKEKIVRKRTLKKQNKIKDNTTRIDILRKWYEMYSRVGYEEFVKETGYKYSKSNLVQAFAKWLPEFVPQNGKSRKNNSREADK